MDEKQKKTIITLVVAGIILIFAAIILYKFWVSILTLGIGFVFGYYFGYTRGKEKRK